MNPTPDWNLDFRGFFDRDLWSRVGKEKMDAGALHPAGKKWGEFLRDSAENATEQLKTVLGIHHGQLPAQAVSLLTRLMQHRYLDQCRAAPSQFISRSGSPTAVTHHLVSGNLFEDYLSLSQELSGALIKERILLASDPDASALVFPELGWDFSGFWSHR